MKQQQIIFRDYILRAPLALAFERFVESELYRSAFLRGPVLDLGCGEGLFASLVFETPFDFGVDPNQHELDRARQNGGHKELLCSKGDAIPLPEGVAATIISNSVFEHIPDVDAVFKECGRLLQPGGRLFITIPTDKFEEYTFSFTLLNFFRLYRLRDLFREKFNSFWVHFHAYPPEKWVQKIESNGFSVERMTVYQPRWACMLNTALTPLALPAFLVKRLTNDWFFFTWLRRPLAWLLRPLAPLLSKATCANEGGLVFFELKKNGDCA